MTATDPPGPDFRQLGLPDALLSSLDDVGYERPSPIQAATIPPMLEGRDVLGHAPTGTGKTAAFALPLIASLLRDDAGGKSPRRLRPADAIRVLVLVPTRELAIQVAEAFRRYANGIDGFRVLPIYGGQDMGGQRQQLKRGVQVVVGTPGRVMDHMRRGTLPLASLTALVLDEADEMLRMGFIDDVQWVLEQIPAERQMALFSATLPKPVRAIAKRHMRAPVEIDIRGKTSTADTIRQRFWLVAASQKLEALTRLLDVEDFDAVLVFVRTRLATAELAERLQARGHAAAALNGDMAQKQREQMIDGLKRGKLDVLVATDVAARGLDVERISHVINFDIPYDSEAYVHRIGRTGRAGRSGDAVLFVTQREKRMLHVIEKATGQRVRPYELPSSEAVNRRRIHDFKQRITDTIAAGDIGFMRELIEQYQREHAASPVDIAAALARLYTGDRPFLLTSGGSAGGDSRAPAPGHTERIAPARSAAADKSRSSDKPDRAPAPDALPMERYEVAVGESHGVKPANLVGAIANEAGIDAAYIGKIAIHDTHSFVDLPTGMPKPVLRDLRKTWVCGQRLMIRLAGSDNPPPADQNREPDRKSAKKTRRNAGKAAAKKTRPSGRKV